MDVTTCHLWIMWLNELSVDPGFQRRFLAWAAVRCPQEWARFAASRGRAVDDLELVVDAALATSRMMSEAMRAELDKLTAVLETRQIMGLL